MRFLYCDMDGITRGKATGTTQLAERLEGGIGLTVAMQAFTMLDRLAPVPGMGPVGEIRLVADPSTFVVAPYAPHTGVVLVDMVTTGGEPYDADGRAFLRRMVERAAGHDLAMIAAFEPEWSLARRQDGELVPFDASLCFDARGMDGAAEVIDEVVTALEEQGMPVEQYYPELGHGSRSSPSATPRRCRPPTSTCSTARRCGRSHAATASTPHSHPGRGPTSPATAATSTSP
ncbi:MAG: glnA, partial [Chloroflexi bacterium]|nr:glnA [Chloroflexota bacterium]